MREISLLELRSVVFILVGFGMLVGGFIVDDYPISVGGLVLIVSSIQVMDLCGYISKVESDLKVIK